MMNQLSALFAAAKAKFTPRRSEKGPVRAFSKFKKKTITAGAFAKSMLAVAADAPMAYRVWVKKEIDPGFREELMLAVAKLNDCKYCSWAHHEWASIDGVPAEELAMIEQMNPEDFDRKKWLAISFVRELTEARFEKVSGELMKKMRAHYSDREIREMILIARVMDAGNLGANTFEALRSRLRGEPASGSRIHDELVLGGVFAFVAPVVVLYLARSSGRSFREMARSLTRYTENAASAENPQ